jgi:hypothetical protein
MDGYTTAHERINERTDWVEWWNGYGDMAMDEVKVKQMGEGRRMDDAEIEQSMAFFG